MNQDQIKQLNEAVEAVKTRKIENVYFVACGGSKAIFDPAQFIFDRETTLPSFVFNANEFIHRCPKGLGENSLVVTCSHSGNTLETTRATQLAGDKGALTISFSYRVDSRCGRRPSIRFPTSGAPSPIRATTTTACSIASCSPS